MRKITISIIVLVFVFNISSAQDQLKYYGEFLLKNYTQEEYGADAQNWAIAQNSKGIMYFGNTNGLLEFDGVNWQRYYLSKNVVVRTIVIDENDIIWVAGSGIFGYFAPDSLGNLQYTPISDKLPKEENIPEIWKIIKTKEAVYFFSINKSYIWRNNQITIINKTLSAHFAWKINNKIYIKERASGLCELNDTTPTPLPNTEKLKGLGGYFNLCEYSKNEILIATVYGFFVYNTKTNQLLTPDIDDDIKNFLMKNTAAYSLTSINNGEMFAVGTFTGGILIVDRNYKLVNIINENRGLQSNCVYYLSSDKDNNLWAALQVGISRIDVSNPIVKYSKKQNVTSYVLDALEFNGRKYLATIDGVGYLPKYNLKIKNDNHSFKFFSKLTYSWDLYSTNNRLFSCGFYGIAQLKDTSYRVVTNIESSANYSMIIPKKRPNYMILGRRNGILVFNIKEAPNSEYVELNKIKFDDKRIEGEVRQINEDKDSNLWFSSKLKGLYYMKFTGDSITDYEITLFNGEKNGLPKQNGTWFTDIIDNEINILTNKGIYKLKDPSKPIDSLTQFVHNKYWGAKFTTDSTECIRIHKLEKDYYYVQSINAGMCKVNKDTLIFDESFFNRLPSITTTSIDENGIINLCTSNAYYTFDTKRKKDYKAQFNTLIRKVYIAKDSIIFKGNFYTKNDSGQLIYSNKQPKNLKPVIDYKNNSVTFEFSATFFEDSDKNTYTYILEGFDENWSKQTEEPKAVYTNISEGTYTFKVKAINVYKTEGAIATYEFTILPPWYRTIWAYITYGTLLVLLIWIIVKLNSRRLIAEKERLEDIVTQRTAEILQQKEEIQTQADNLQEANDEITQQKEELQKLSIVASETNNAVLIFDEKLNLEWVNEGYTKIYGDKNKELIKTGNFNLLQQSMCKDIAQIVKKAIVNKKSIVYEVKNLEKNKKEVWVQTALTPFFENDKLKKIIAIESDITEIQKAKNQILSQNIQIKSSIDYALTIQQASLPLQSEISKSLDYFIIYKPKDIVSGDFYWFSELPNNAGVIFAEIDCTGHGVPGAFMSLIGNTLLNEIVNFKKITDPAEILTELDIQIKKVLQQEKTDNLDGMDLSLCKYQKNDNKNTKVIFSGAKQNLFYFKQREKQIQILNGDRKNIGGMLKKMRNDKFTNKEIILQKNDMIYLSSDGFIDQNNSERKKIGSTRFIEKLNEIATDPLAFQESKLLSMLSSWQGTEKQRDDITVIGIKVR